VQEGALGNGDGVKVLPVYGDEKVAQTVTNCITTFLEKPESKETNTNNYSWRTLAQFNSAPTFIKPKRVFMLQSLRGCSRNYSFDLQVRVLQK
jgi:hypothetical protein